MAEDLQVPEVAAIQAVKTTGASDNSDVVILRNPTTFYTTPATALGLTPVWTPASGKKFRLLKFCMSATANIGISGGAMIVTATLYDGTTPLPFSFDFFIPQSANLSSQIDDFSPFIDLGGIGKLSSLVNNVLNVNLTSALTSGQIRIFVAGTEE